MRLYFDVNFKNKIQGETQLALDSIAFTTKEGKRYNLDIAESVDYKIETTSFSGRVKWYHYPELFEMQEEGDSDYFDIPDKEFIELLSDEVSDVEIVAGYWDTSNNDEFTDFDISEFELEFNFGNMSYELKGNPDTKVKVTPLSWI